MTKRAALLSVLVLLLVFAGVAWAGQPQTSDFTITGITTSISPWPPGRRSEDPAPWPPRIRPDGTLKLHIKAAGIVSEGWSEGSAFTFQEWVVTDTTDYSGFNNGRMTIEADDGSKAVIEFEGPAGPAGVSGDWWVHHGTGQFKKLQGGGTYSGDAGLCDPAKVPPAGCSKFSVHFVSIP